jgi:uncharacterized repeat protein (TIGR03803 family)
VQYKIHRSITVGLSGTVLLLTGAAFAHVRGKVIFTFPTGNGVTAGSSPNGGLVADATGTLYGTTNSGGSGNCQVSGKVIGCGTVFKLTPPTKQGGDWTEAVLYNFQGSSDGAEPRAGLAFDKTGALYGTTSSGGANLCDYGQGPVGCGTVFKLAPSKGRNTWTESVIYRFQNGSDGAIPISSLIVDSAGSLYGTTEFGGSRKCSLQPVGCGVVFQLALSNGVWQETTLYEFQGTPDGQYPAAGLLFDSKGNLYGTTSEGGTVSFGLGTVFELSPSQGGVWSEKVLYSFQGNADGSLPTAPVIIDQNGNLYGTTSGQGSNSLGTVFSLAPPGGGSGIWMETVIYGFGGYKDGNEPLGPVLLDRLGKLVGTTSSGGAISQLCGFGCGTLFQLTPGGQGGAWSESFVFDFNGSDGSSPDGAVIPGKGGALYGTTIGGVTNLGTVFGVLPQ